MSDWIGLEEIDDGIWNVYFGPLKLGRLQDVPVKGFLDSVLPLNGFIMPPASWSRLRSRAEPALVSGGHDAR
jgi:hypothetical protein